MRTFTPIFIILLTGIFLLQCTSDTEKTVISSDNSVSNKINITETMNAESDIETSLRDIITNGESGAAFVIFSLKGTEFYVQYALDQNGLNLNLPDGYVFTKNHFDKLENLLISENFEKKEPDNNNARDFISKLKERQFTIYDDGIYAQAGKDLNFIKRLTISTFNEVLEAEGTFELEVQIEING